MRKLALRVLKQTVIHPLTVISHVRRSRFPLTSSSQEPNEKRILLPWDTNSLKHVTTLGVQGDANIKCTLDEQHQFKMASQLILTFKAAIITFFTTRGQRKQTVNITYCDILPPFRFVWET